MLTASWLLRCSHRPSEANMRNWSSGCSLCTEIDGSELRTGLRKGSGSLNLGSRSLCWTLPSSNMHHQWILKPAIEIRSSFNKGNSYCFFKSPASLIISVCTLLLQCCFLLNHDEYERSCSAKILVWDIISATKTWDILSKLLNGNILNFFFF